MYKVLKNTKKSSKWGFVQSADFLPYRLPCSNTKFCTFYSLQSTATTGIPIHTTEKPPYLRPQDTREKMFSSFWLGNQYSCAARGRRKDSPSSVWTELVDTVYQTAQIQSWEAKTAPTALFYHNLPKFANFSATFVECPIFGPLQYFCIFASNVWK